MIRWLLVTFCLSAGNLSFGQVLLQKAQPTDGNQLGFIIMGTIAQKTPDNNVALIKVKSTGSVTAIKIGTVIVDGKYKVTDISEKYIRVMTRDAKHFLVFMDKFSGEFKQANSGPHKVINPEGKYKEEGFEREAGKVTMTSSYRDKIVNQDLSTILMQATAEPFVQDGVIAGFKMSQIDSDSIFAKGGLRDEDIITALNGQKLNNVAGAITLLKSLKGATAIEVDVIRSGTPVSISVNVQ